MIRPIAAAVALIAVGVAGIRAQESTLANGWRLHVDEVPNGRSAAVAVVWPCGRYSDPADCLGRSLAVGQWFRREGERTCALGTVAVEVRGPVLIATWSGPSRAVEEVGHWLAALAAASPDRDPDFVAKALATARLDLDNLTEVFPGPILRQHVRAELTAGTPPARPLGRDDHLAALSAEDLAAVVRRTVRSAPRCALVGAGAGALRLGLSRLPRADAAPASPAVDPADPAPRAIPGRQVDGAYVTLPLRAPEPDAPGAQAREDYLAFAVGLEILRLRAQVEFPGGVSRQSFAGLLPVHFDVDLRDSIAFLSLRGPDGATAKRPTRDLWAFATALRPGAWRDQDIAAAWIAVRSRLDPPLPRSSQLASEGAAAALLPRARGRALGLHFGVSVAELNDPGPEAVRRVMAAALAAAAEWREQELWAVVPSTGG